MASSRLARVVRADDVRMVKAADRLHFAAKAGSGQRVVEVVLGEHLDRDDLV